MADHAGDEIAARAHLVELAALATGILEMGMGNGFIAPQMREGRYVALVVWDEGCHHTIAMTSHPIRAVAADRAKRAMSDGHYVGSRALGEENGSC